MLNLVMTVFHVMFFAFIIIAGFYNGSAKNLVKPSGLAPFGVKGVLDGAAIVYFSYIGYDSVSTMAEEIQNPSKALPVGIVGSVLVVCAMYCLMALALCVMVPYNLVRICHYYIIIVAMLGQARYLCVIGRARLVPSWLAKVNPTTGTPLNATLFLGLCTASIALFTDLSIVFDMISISTLLVFYLVANALIYRRYVMISHNPPSQTLTFLFLLTATSIGLSIAWKLQGQWWGLPVFGGAMIAITGLFQMMVPYVCHADEGWLVPLMPWPAAISIFLNVFLMTTLKMLSFQRFAIWGCLITIFYVLYGVHSTYNAEEIGTDGRVVDHEIPQHNAGSAVSVPMQQNLHKLEIQML
ncbi:Cationic amino acid transporter 7, chloroplastic [Linum perenne]